MKLQQITKQQTVGPLTTSWFKPAIGAGTPTKQLRIRFAKFASSLELTPIKFKLIKESGWTLTQANRVEGKYKAFLFLMGAQQGQMMVPSTDIDEMWHAHVLDTRKYMADCAQHFGEYIHHYPYLGMKDEADDANAKALFAKSCQAIANILGEFINEKELASCGGGGGCGGGASCGGSGASCSSGHTSCGGHGHGHGNTGNSDGASIFPVISSCGSSGSDRSKPSPTPTTPSRPSRPSTPAPEKRRGIIRKILGLSPAHVTGADARWAASVTPALFKQADYRPDAVALSELSGKQPTVH